MQKFLVVVTPEARDRLIDDPRLSGARIVQGERDGVLMWAIESTHRALRFDLAGESGVVVLPGPHDPVPIGDLHVHLPHVDAAPHHTMRDVMLRLHEKLGAEWHPDT